MLRASKLSHIHNRVGYPGAVFAFWYFDPEPVTTKELEQPLLLTRAPKRPITSYL